MNCSGHTCYSIYAEGTTLSKGTVGRHTLSLCSSNRYRLLSAILDSYDSQAPETKEDLKKNIDFLASFIQSKEKQ